MTATDRVRAVAVVAVLVALVPLLLLRRIEARLSRGLLETDESMYVLPLDEWLVPMSLGYREAAAGMIWAQFLTYFGGQVELNGTHAHTERYVVAVTELDPYFYRAYTFGSTAAIYNGLVIDRGAVEQSIRAIERGLEVYPEDGELYYQLGFLHFFELPPLVPPDEARRARRQGIDEICTGAILGGGPPYLPLVCSRLSSRAGLEGVAIDHLVRSLVEADDETTRARIEDRLEASMSADQAYAALQRISEYRRRWQAELPYAPGGFYGIAGPRPPVPLEDEVEMPFAIDAIIEAGEEQLLFMGDDDEGEAPTEPAGAATPPADAGTDSQGSR